VIMNMNTIMVTFLDACMHTHIQYTYTVYTFINSKFLHKFLGPVEIYFIPLTTTTTTCFDLIWFDSTLDLIFYRRDVISISFLTTGMEWNGMEFYCLTVESCRTVSYRVVSYQIIKVSPLNHDHDPSIHESKSVIYSQPLKLQ